MSLGANPEPQPLVHRRKEDQQQWNIQADFCYGCRRWPPGLFAISFPAAPETTNRCRLSAGTDHLTPSEIEDPLVYDSPGGNERRRWGVVWPCRRVLCAYRVAAHVSSR